MMKGIIQITILVMASMLFSCSGGNDNSSEADKVESPGPVNEGDRSRYNLNAPDEMMLEMQDSTAADTTENGEMQDTLID